MWLMVKPGSSSHRGNAFADILTMCGPFTRERDVFITQSIVGASDENFIKVIQRQILTFDFEIKSAFVIDTVPPVTTILQLTQILHWGCSMNFRKLKRKRFAVESF